MWCRNAGGVARLQRRQEGQVPIGRVRQRPAMPGRPQAEAVGMQDAARQDRLHGMQAGDPEQGEVERRIRLHHGPEIVIGGGPAHVAEQPAELSHARARHLAHHRPAPPGPRSGGAAQGSPPPPCGADR